MRHYQRKNLHSFMTYVIAVGILLRSFIAPGFMLDTADGLRITFCDGVAGFYTYQQNSSDHAHHHDQENEDDNNLLVTPSCQHWSTSGLLVINTFILNISFPEFAVTTVFYPDPYIEQFFFLAQPNRGPPSFS